MEDKEIGELWRWHTRQQYPTPNGFGNSDIICKLIRQLVIERAWNYTAYAYPARPAEDLINRNFIMLALRDFDINMTVDKWERGDGRCSK